MTKFGSRIETTSCEAHPLVASILALLDHDWILGLYKFLKLLVLTRDDVIRICQMWSASVEQFDFNICIWWGQKFW